MRRKRIYLDTSVISYLLQEDAPQRMRDTRAFWDILKTGKYAVHVSEVVLAELSACPEPKRTQLLTLLEEIEYTEIAVEGNRDVLALAAQIKELDILPPKSENDRLHMAAAVFSECAILVSWNFRHMVNVRTIDGARVVCVANDVRPIDIYTPAVLLEGSERNDSDFC